MHMRSSLQSAEQLALDLFGEQPMPTPGQCQFELHLLEHGEKPKSACGFRGTTVWTNCREVGKCLWDGWHQQGTSDGLTTGGDDDGGDS